MNRKLIFVDVDDTLFSNTTSTVPDSAIEAIKQAQKNGHKIFINTGRPFSYFEKEIVDIGFDGFLCCNGLDLRVGDQSVFYKALPADIGKEMIKLVVKNHIKGTLQGHDCLYFYDHDIDFHPHYGYMLQCYDRNSYMTHAFSWDHAKNYEKLSCFSKTKEDMQNFVKDLKDIDFEFDCVRITDNHYEILQKGYHKGTAIEFIAKYFHQTTEDCYAFGDSNNDTEMLTTAKYGIAMGNACDELKSIADYITTSVDENGLFHAFQHFKLI